MATSKNFMAPPAAADPQFVKSDSIILRRSDYSETSFVLLLLTRDRGRMGVLAKGARRPKGIFSGEIDLFARGQAVIIVRPRGTLHILTEFSCRERYLGLRKTPDRATAARYIAEVAGDAAPEGEAQPEIYDLLAQSLGGLERGEVPAVLAYFQVHLLRLSGYMPNLRECVVCGEQLEGAIAAYSFTNRGLTCARHRVESDPAIEVSTAAISLIRSLARGRAAAPSRLRIAPALARETIAFLGYVIAAAFEREPRMLQPLLAMLLRRATFPPNFP